MIFFSHRTSSDPSIETDRTGTERRDTSLSLAPRQPKPALRTPNPSEWVSVWVERNQSQRNRSECTISLLLPQVSKQTTKIQTSLTNHITAKLTSPAPKHTNKHKLRCCGSRARISHPPTHIHTHTQAASISEWEERNWFVYCAPI